MRLQSYQFNKPREGKFLTLGQTLQGDGSSLGADGSWRCLQIAVFRPNSLYMPMKVFFFLFYHQLLHIFNGKPRIAETLSLAELEADD